MLSAATNWLAFACILGVSFFLTPTLIHALGKSRYDVWCIVESILNYFTLLEFGIATCVVRAIARSRVTPNIHGRNRLISSCLAVYLAAGSVALLVGGAVLAMFAPHLSAKADDVLPFALLMLVNMSISLPLSLFPSILDGLDQFTIKSIVRIIVLTVRTSAILYQIQQGCGLLEIAIIYTVCNILEHGIMIVLCYRLLPGMTISRRLVDRATLAEVRGSSLHAFLAMLAGRITLQTGAILIGAFLPIGQATYFTTASRLIEYAKTLMRTITATLTPSVSVLEAQGDRPGIARMLLGATRIVLYFTLPIHIGLILFGKPFLSRWVGPDFVDGSYPAIQILSATLTIGVIQSVAARILYGLGRLKDFSRIVMSEAACNLALSIILLPILGVRGIAFAIAVPNVVGCLVIVGYTLRVLDVSLGRYLRIACFRPMLAAFVPLGVWLWWGDVQADWFAIARPIGVGMVCYATMASVLELAARYCQWGVSRAMPSVSEARIEVHLREDESRCAESIK